MLDNLGKALQEAKFFRALRWGAAFLKPVLQLSARLSTLQNTVCVWEAWGLTSQADRRVPPRQPFPSSRHAVS